MNTIIRITIFILVGLFSAVNLHAVTEQEMEQAKTIAAKAYLRYANNGSGYLDEQKPTTMADLKKGLKAKEIENLKSFNAVAAPKDYASWDKNKLVEYWSVTFFKAPGLIEAGKGARNVVKKQISAMTIAAPGAANDAKGKEENSGEVKTNIPVSLVEDDTPAATQENIADDMQKKQQEADSIAALVAADAGVQDEPKKKSSGTWIYVTILIVLIAVVVWLVVYASKTMNAKNDPVRTSGDSKEEAAPAVQTEAPAREKRVESSLKSEFAQTIARKNEELKRLSDEVQSLGNACRELEETNRHLEGEKTRLMAEVEALRLELHAARENKASAIAAAAPVEKVAPRPKRSIYLGRVNARGLFVRADRTLNAEGSVYLIETEDGYNGSFRVVNVPEVCERALSNPTQWLAGGCVAHDLLNTAGMTEIHTEATGDAVFESGCWRVVRKAKISYS